MPANWLTKQSGCKNGQLIISVRYVFNAGLSCCVTPATSSLFMYSCEMKDFRYSIEISDIAKFRGLGVVDLQHNRKLVSYDPIWEHETRTPG